MSAPTTHSEENGRVEKGPSGELKKTVSNKTPSVDGSTCRKDDDKIKFRGPDGGPKTYSKEELKKLQVRIEIKKPKAENPSPKVPFDPNFIVPVRRPGEGKVPLFSRLPAVNDDDDGNAKKENPLSKEKKKEKSEPGKSHSSRPSTKSRSRSPGSSSRRSDRKYKDYISERDDYIRRRKEAYLREREKFRRTHQRRSRHRSHSRSRSSSSTGSSSDDRKSRSSSRGSSYSHSKSRSIRKHHRSRGSHRSRTRSRSRSRSRDYRRDRSHEQNDPRHHGPGPSNMRGVIPYHGPPWVNRPPFRHPFMPGPPIPFYPAPMIYAAPPPFRPYPPAFRGAPRIPGRRP